MQRTLVSDSAVFERLQIYLIVEKSLVKKLNKILLRKLGPLLSIDWEEENLEIQSYKPLPSSRPETVMIIERTEFLLV